MPKLFFGWWQWLLEVFTGCLQTSCWRQEVIASSQRNRQTHNPHKAFGFCTDMKFVYLWTRPCWPISPFSSLWAELSVSWLWLHIKQTVLTLQESEYADFLNCSFKVVWSSPATFLTQHRYNAKDFTFLYVQGNGSALIKILIILCTAPCVSSYITGMNLR